MSHRPPSGDPYFDLSDDELEDDGFADLPSRNLTDDPDVPSEDGQDRGEHLASEPSTGGQHLAGDLPPITEEELQHEDWQDDEATPETGEDGDLDHDLPNDGGDTAEDAGPEEDVDVDVSSSDEDDDDVDLSDFERMSVDRYTNEEYVAATTQEYQGLADEMNRANEEQYERKAVAATMAGLESGIIGFDDVTGDISPTGEEVEREAQAKASDLTVRVTTSVVLVGLFLGTLAWGGWAYATFIILAMILSLGEFYATVRRGGYRPLALFGLLGVIGAGIGAQAAGPFAIAAAMALTMVATILFYTLTGRRLATENMTVTLLGAAWISLFAFGISIGREAANPFAMVFFVAVVTAAFDIGGYFVGRSVGNRPMAPQISPQKTVEGYFGGVVGAIIVAAILSTLPFNEEIGFVGALIFAVVVSILAPLGDLAESVIKRGLGVKDMGSVLPGHGGMLDRIDSFLFVVPGAYVFLYLVDLV